MKPTPIGDVLSAGDPLRAAAEGARTESPIEERFAELLAPHLHPLSTMQQQRTLVTSIGKVRVDFFVTCSRGLRLVIECDGKGYHDPERDRRRDAAIIGGDLADHVLRFTGSDIVSRKPSVLAHIADYAPDLFTDRALIVIRQQAEATEFRGTEEPAT